MTNGIETNMQAIRLFCSDSSRKANWPPASTAGAAADVKRNDLAASLGVQFLDFLKVKQAGGGIEASFPLHVVLAGSRIRADI